MHVTVSSTDCRMGQTIGDRIERPCVKARAAASKPALASSPLLPDQRDRHQKAASRACVSCLPAVGTKSAILDMGVTIGGTSAPGNKLHDLNAGD